MVSLDISCCTSQCRPWPAKGSLPALCVQETKTLHAQHIMTAIHSHSCSQLEQQCRSMCACVKRPTHCMLSTNRTCWGIPVSFFKKLTVYFYIKHSQQLCEWHDNPIQSQLGTLIRPTDGLEMLWLELLVVNYLQVHNLMFVYYTWGYTNISMNQ